MSAAIAAVVLEPAAAEFAGATAGPPYLLDLGPVDGRAAIDEVQAGGIARPDAAVEDLDIPGGPSGPVPARIVRPPGASGVLPVILYLHGAGWVFGSARTHDRLIRELAVGAGAAVVFPEYSRSPEARYPVAVEEVYGALAWVAARGRDHGLDGGRVAVAGDGAGGNLAAAVTLVAKERAGPGLAAQVLFYPVTDAAMATPSYDRFASGYFLRRDVMRWFWDQYAPDEGQRAQITASPLRATLEQLTGLPRALVITAEADVLRAEGEAYAARLRAAGVDVTAVRFAGIIHDFVMLNALRGTNAAEAAITQAVAYLRRALA